MEGRRIRLLMAACLGATGLPSASASGPAAAAECFDAEISATIVRQTPTVIPECDGCIIIRWPWIVDLRVRRVHHGSVALGPLTVLTLQHTYYRTGLGARRWLLRRNTLGSFNVVVPPEEGTLPRCSANAPAAEPFIAGRPLDDLRREGEARYGRRPET
jgi:hypothetical protein